MIFTCHLCNISFNTRSELTTHRNTQHNTKALCKYCGKPFSRSGLKKHESLCSDNPESIKERSRIGNIISQAKALSIESNLPHTFYCSYCGKECNNKNSLMNHQRLCPSNTERDISYISERKNRKAWNKGLTKETDDKVRQRGVKLKSRYQSGELVSTFKGKHHSEETKELLRQIAIDNQFEKHFRRRNTYTYKNFVFMSDYELQVAKSLDENNIEWSQPTRLSYTAPDGSKHTYLADFYLPEFDVYLDPKNDYLIENVNPVLGYKDVDKIKWVCEQNNVIVLILSKNELTWDKIKHRIERRFKDA